MKKAQLLRFPNIVNITVLKPMDHPMLLDHSALDADAVILYDSYSSNLLKGVRFSHRNLKAQVVALQLQFEFNSPVILQQTGIQVGTSLLQMLVSLTTGGMLIMIPYGNNPTEISGLILEKGVDTTFASHDEYSLWLEYGS
jgi:non-ribosomal peptide synthetase component F